MAEDNPDHWYCTNLTGIPSQLLASTAFNQNPQRVCLHGTRVAHPGLFRLLSECCSQLEAAEVFQHYMALQFDLADSRAEEHEVGYRSSSYVELLRGWGFDSSSPQGAVLKGWVESRFGLIPVYHGERLGHFPSLAWVRYLEEKHSSRFHNNCIQLQLDILYEYCQWSLSRFGDRSARHVALWRGSNDCEYQIVSGSLREASCVLRLNNLVSFSRTPDVAEIFGDWLFQTEVPKSKLLLFPGLLADPVLRSEGEFLVIGGCYSVKTYRGWPY